MTRLHRLNPVTRVLAVLFWALPLLSTVDVVSAACGLLVVLVASPLLGTSWGQLFRRGWPVLVAAPLGATSMLLYATPGGEIHASFLTAVISDHSILMAAAIMLRIVAIGWPVIVLTRGVDPTDLGDGLAQVLRLPARFVIGAVAGTRLVTLLGEDWDSLARARRARGVADTGRLRRLMTMSFSLLVLSLRRSAKLATAMEARGFGRETGRPRTWARPSHFARRDIVFLVVVGALSVGCVAAAVATGYVQWLGVSA